MSFTRRARLPPCLMMTRLNSRHSGWLGMMPRSRQMSAMTAPIGRRRTSAAICAGVGRRARRGSASAVAGAAAGRGARGLGCDGAAGGAASRRSALRISLASSASARCRPREMRDEDQCDVGGAEAGSEGGGVREGAPADRGGEFAAVVDELVDEGEEGRRAARLGGWIRGFGRGGHERDVNMKRGRVARNIFRVVEKAPGSVRPRQSQDEWTAGSESGHYLS